MPGDRDLEAFHLGHARDDRLDRITRRNAALLAGEHAQLKGKPLHANPFDPPCTDQTSDGGGDRLRDPLGLHARWRDGWAGAAGQLQVALERPAAVPKFRPRPGMTHAAHTHPDDDD